MALMVWIEDIRHGPYVCQIALWQAMITSSQHNELFIPTVWSELIVSMGDLCKVGKTIITIIPKFNLDPGIMIATSFPLKPV